MLDLECKFTMYTLYVGLHVISHPSMLFVQPLFMTFNTGFLGKTSTLCFYENKTS